MKMNFEVPANPTGGHITVIRIRQVGNTAGKKCPLCGEICAGWRRNVAGGATE